jgi:uncharacterized protein (DUF1684 family)
MDPSEHERLILAWQRARQDRLRAPNGWLALVDRLPLTDGDNALPFGTVTLRGGAVSLRGATGERPLRLEEAITHEGKTYELAEREGELGFRVKDPASPALLAFTGLPYYPIDLAWRITARFERYDPPRTTEHQYGSGAVAARTIPGAAHFSAAGHDVTLEPTLEPSSGRLYLIFGDQTNRDETYPAGRFLYAEVPPPGATTVVLDFNMAFNPPCAFTEHAACPVTPSRHRLPLRVPAGEKRP